MRITQRQITAYTNLHTTNVSQWRTYGYLNGIGRKEPGGQWHYRPSEAVALWLADCLRPARITEREACAIAVAHARVAAMILTGATAPYRYVCILHGDGEGAVIPAASLAEIESDAFHTADVIDLHALAAQATDGVREWAQAALS